MLLRASVGGYNDIWDALDAVYVLRIIGRSMSKIWLVNGSEKGKN